MRARLLIRLVALIALLGISVACGDSSGKTKITIYTSIYDSVITQLRPILEEQFPEIEVVWFAKGSEEVAARVNAEIATGKIRGDLIMTSDPFWYLELKEAGHLLAYDSPLAEAIPADLKDPDNAFVTVRVPVMVMTANGKKLAEDERPKGFASLRDPKWAGRITMGDPLKSGTNFSAVAALSDRYGWEYFEALKGNKMLSAGGNGSVMGRVTTAEREVGVILLENLLKEKAENPESPAEIIYPEDGAILVPSPMAITADCKNPDAAKKIYDFMLSEAGQKAIVAGYMYSPIDAIAPPAGARPWSEVYDSALVPWSPDYLAQTRDRREEIKEKFSAILSP